MIERGRGRTKRSSLSCRRKAQHYDELLKLLEAAVDVGEFSGNKTFDAQALTDLRTAAQEFSKLPVGSAGQRVTDDALNRPAELLRARYNALVSEAKDFDSRAAQLLQVLGKDAQLIEQILAAANLESWAAGKTPVAKATATKWDYAMGYGPRSRSDAGPHCHRARGTRKAGICGPRK
jgi:hypothetical protein